MKAFISYSHVYWLVQAALLQVTDLLINWDSSDILQVAWCYSALYLSFWGPTEEAEAN